MPATDDTMQGSAIIPSKKKFHLFSFWHADIAILDNTNKSIQYSKTSYIPQSF